MRKTKPRPKSCYTCAHRTKGSTGFDVCLLSGYHVEVERKVPTVCGEDFGGWVEKEGFVSCQEL